jgi:hypothetical protein
MIITRAYLHYQIESMSKGIPFSMIRLIIPDEKLLKFHSSNTINKEERAIVEYENPDISYITKHVKMYSLAFSIILLKS